MSLSAALRRIVDRIGRPGRLFLAVALVAPLAVAGCAVGQLDPDARDLPPPATGGAAEERLSETRYRISYAAEGDFTRAERQAGLIRRAAELTLNSGFDHFVVVNRSSFYGDERDDAASDVGVNVGVFGGSSSGIGVGLIFGAPRSVRRGRPIAEVAEIEMLAGPAPEGDPDAYDAAALIGR